MYPTEQVSYSLIFIDDDAALTNAWKFHSKMRGITIMTYNCISEFMKDVDNYVKTTPIYIDSDLKDIMPGQEFAKKLYAMGFTQLYLATGYPADMFSSMPWIKSIVGKTPPF